MTAEELGRLVKKLRDERGLTQGQLAEYAGVKRSWLSHIEAGLRKKPERELLEKVAVILHVPAATLLSVAGYRVTPLPLPPQQTAEDLLRQLEVRIKTSPILVPETTQPASAGWGISVEAEYWPYLPEPAERGHRFIAVAVSGDCMEPQIRAGHKVIVDLDASPKNGDIVLAIHDGESLVKILEKRNDDAYLVALKKRPPIKVDEGTRVLGVVRTVTYRPK